MSDVFISYSREDRPVAQFLAEVLGRAGYDVWFDRDLLSGDDFEREIGSQLATARAVIVLWSERSVRSLFVRDEATAAAERGVLVPVRLNGTSVPMGFRSIHVIQFDQSDPAELMRAIVRLMAKAGKAAPPPPLPIKARTGLGVVELACLLAVLAAVGAFLAMLLRNH